MTAHTHIPTGQPISPRTLCPSCKREGRDTLLVDSPWGPLCAEAYEAAIREGQFPTTPHVLPAFEPLREEIYKEIMSWHSESHIQPWVTDTDWEHMAKTVAARVAAAMAGHP